MYKTAALILFSFISYVSVGQRLTENYHRANAAIYYQNYDLASKFIDSAIVTNPRNPTFWLKKGEIEFRKKDFDQAISSFINAESIREGVASYWLARSYSMLGDTTNAFSELRIHLSSPNKQSEASILLDSALNLLKNTPQWKNIWKSEWYSNNELLLADIAYLFSREEWDHALDILNERMHERKSRHYLYALRGEAYYMIGSYKASEKDFANALKRSKRNTSYMAWLAKAMIMNNKQKKAIKLLSNAIDMSGGEPNYFKQRAIAFANNNEHVEAVEDIKHFISFYPTDMEAVELLAEYSYLSGKLIDALLNLGILIKNQPQNPKFYFLRAEIYMKSKNWEMAKIDLDKAIKINPKVAEYFLNRGICYHNMGIVDNACNDWKQSMQLGNFSAQELIYKNCR